MLTLTQYVRCLVLDLKTEPNLQHNNTECAKLSFYSTLFNYDVKNLDIQPFLCLPLPKNLVSYLAKVRINAHKLHFETCRYCYPAIPRENRCCFHYKNIVDDENIFLLNCSL